MYLNLVHTNSRITLLLAYSGKTWGQAFHSVITRSPSRLLLFWSTTTCCFPVPSSSYGIVCTATVISCYITTYGSGNCLFLRPPGIQCSLILRVPSFYACFRAAFRSFHILDRFSWASCILNSWPKTSWSTKVSRSTQLPLPARSYTSYINTSATCIEPHLLPTYFLSALPSTPSDLQPSSSGTPDTLVWSNHVVIWMSSWYPPSLPQKYHQPM